MWPDRPTSNSVTVGVRDEDMRAIPGNNAGAYAVQETGDEFVERIEGSLTNVVGLPMKLLQRLLNDIL